jgi:uncharacterized protein YndB with AHSA1/START domain
VDAKNRNGLIVTLPSEREVTLTRSFDAPRDLVFEAWTTPDHVKKWFGPSGYTLPVCEIDLRVGGAFRYVMRGPDGASMTMRGEYREIAAPERLVYTEGYDEFPGPPSLVTLTLEEHEGRTTLTSRVLYPSAEVRDAVLAMGMADGAGQTLDRLAELLQTIR